ncbi:polysaccharide deacetylase family protein [Facklamia miroungae]|uniref:Peptidoglycan/xylan/chitin deacetylase, PgdA/CDA1 family n=1 Tax=Facklamia miroungae TaxID=120956 RepID=A0A1G7RX67_9LACT|nr:polysaccharide deacetylase family protein [Facklamia miroungae]NKZ29242.1 polysaccharide deacetylase family protein [Facklamia miroungae]SDG15365.1 Peptidoglycan/xylan/chitin deacetylase, PgdA/CDA1 family [Facklamia miroungae]
MYKKIVASILTLLALGLILFLGSRVYYDSDSELSKTELRARKNNSPESYRTLLADLYEEQPLTAKGIKQERKLKEVSLADYNIKIEQILNALTDGNLKKNIKLMAENDRKILELNHAITDLKIEMEDSNDYPAGLFLKVKKIDHQLKSLQLTRAYKDLSTSYQSWGKAIQEKSVSVPNKIYADPDLGKYLNDPSLTSEDSSEHSLSSKFVVLTFDDGPNPITTPQILDTLKFYDVKASFFVLGQNAEKYPDIIKRMQDEGHLIGNHSYSHRNFTLISEAEILDELNRTNQIIESATHASVNYYRMPYGAGGQREMQLTKMTPVLWNVDSEDWKSRNEQMIINRVNSTLRPDPVILMHDIYQETANSLGTIIENIRRNGYQFVRLDEMM